MKKRYDPLAAVQAAGPPGTISFVYGLPDPVTFPSADLMESLSKTLRETPDLALQYGPEQGYGPLIDALIEKSLRTEGLRLDRTRIMLTGGAAQALDQICTLMTRPGETVLVEAPTYHESLRSFADHGLTLRQVAIDEQGLVTDDLRAALQDLGRRKKKVGFIYVIPSFQNPSGITLSGKRRLELLALCQRFRVPIVEDDVYHDLRYQGDGLPSIYSLDKNGRTLRLGSFSKIMSPGLRLGWMMAPPHLIERFVNSGLRNMGGGPNPLIAVAMSDYCHRGLLEPHIKFLVAHYRAKRDVMLRMLKETMPPGGHWTEPEGGFFVWLELPAPLKARDFVRKARGEKLLLAAGDDFFAESTTGRHVRLAFSFLEPAQITKGIKLLADLIRQQS